MCVDTLHKGDNDDDDDDDDDDDNNNNNNPVIFLPHADRNRISLNSNYTNINKHAYKRI